MPLYAGRLEGPQLVVTLDDCKARCDCGPVMQTNLDEESLPLRVDGEADPTGPLRKPFLRVLYRARLAFALPLLACASASTDGYVVGDDTEAADVAMQVASSSPITDGGMADASVRSASSLPPISDPGAKGPFAVEVKENLEGLRTHILIAPKDLGRDGIKHPIMVWINGAGTSSSSYRAMLDNVAAHGFFLLDDKQSTFEVPPEVSAQRAAIDWAIAEAGRVGGPYYGKLDTTRIAIAGQSLGSVATFGNVGDPRIKTSIHFAGGLLGNPQRVDEGWMKGLHVPAAFLCGDRDTNGLPRVRRDFDGAPPSVPVFFGLLAGVGHTDEFNKPNGGRWGRFLIAWLRWKLADDASFARYFQGPSCEFCRGDWTAKKRGID